MSKDLTTIVVSPPLDTEGIEASNYILIGGELISFEQAVAVERPDGTLRGELFGCRRGNDQLPLDEGDTQR